MDGQPPHDLLTVAEVAAALRVSRMTVYRLMQEGTLAAIKVRGSWRIPRSALRQVMGGGEAD